MHGVATCSSKAKRSNTFTGRCSLTTVLFIQPIPTNWQNTDRHRRVSNAIAGQRTVNALNNRSSRGWYASNLPSTLFAFDPFRRRRHSYFLTRIINIFIVLFTFVHTRVGIKRMDK